MLEVDLGLQNLILGSQTLIPYVVVRHPCTGQHSAHKLIAYILVGFLLRLQQGCCCACGTVHLKLHVIY